MTATLICLISDQRMQNAIPLFQKDRCYERVFLIVSEENGQINKRFAGYAEDFIAAFADNAACTIAPAAVDPMDPNSTKTVIESLASGPCRNDEITINFTGGTKPMSIGAFHAGISLGCNMLYIDTQKEQIYTYIRGTSSIEPFDLETITVRHVLRAHGKDIQPAKKESAVETDFGLSEQIAAHGPESFHLLIHLHDALTTFIKAEEKKYQQIADERKNLNMPALERPKGMDREYQLSIKDFRTAPWLVEGFLQAGVMRREDSHYWLNNRAFKYLNGDWLELFVYHLLAKKERFNDLLFKVLVTGIENEIDIACTLNAKLALIECKIGKVNGSATQPILGRLRALKESLAGAFGKSFLITTTRDANINDQFRLRAKEYSSRVIGLEELMNAEKIIYEELTRRER